MMKSEQEWEGEEGGFLVREMEEGGDHE